MRLRNLILEKLVELGEVALDAFFPAKYPEARLWRMLLGLDRRYRFSRRSFSAIISQLRAQGLVERRGENRSSRWRITELGKRHLRSQTDSRARITDGIQRIVAFDIPERERAKRDAVRTELVAAGYLQLQKSVWIGERPLPGDFLELLDELNLVGKVHMFSIREHGTLRGE